MSKPPRRPQNADVRSREHLTQDEVFKLVKAARKLGRHGHRDSVMILVAYRHGLRVSELVGLRWDQVHLDQGEMHVRRRKKGKPSTQPITAEEIRALRRLRRDHPESPFVFVTERGGPMEESVFRKIVKRAGEEAGLDLPVHPHMLRHATGFVLANKGLDTRLIQDFLGHQNIQSTVIYTTLSSKRFRKVWDD